MPRSAPLAELVEVPGVPGKDGARIGLADTVVPTTGAGGSSYSEPEQARLMSIRESDSDMLFTLDCQSRSKHEHDTVSTIDAQWLGAIIKRLRSRAGV